MSLTVEVWQVLVLLTVFGWAVFFSWPWPRGTGMYDFSGLIVLFWMFMGIILTLVMWLVYFAIV